VETSLCLMARRTRLGLHCRVAVLVSLLICFGGFTSRARAQATRCPELSQSSTFSRVGGEVVLNGQPAPVGTLVNVMFKNTLVGCATVAKAGTFAATAYGNEPSPATVSFPHQDDPLDIQINGMKATVQVTMGADHTKQYPLLVFEDKTGWIVRAEASGAGAAGAGGQTGDSSGNGTRSAIVVAMVVVGIAALVAGAFYSRRQAAPRKH